MSLDSTVGVAKVGTKSLRATVPEGIAAFLEIQAGDKLEWRMDFQNGERMVIVQKAKPLPSDIPESASKTSRKRK